MKDPRDSVEASDKHTWRLVIVPEFRNWFKRPRYDSQAIHLPITLCCRCGRLFLQHGSGRDAVRCSGCQRLDNIASATKSERESRARDVVSFREQRAKTKREWRIRNPNYRPYDPKYAWKSNLRQYGLTPEQYDAMLAAQDGVCAICERTDVTGRRLAVDHCHKTGAVRGLLCAMCNTAIGKLGDSVELVERALNYLRRSQ